MILCSQLRSLQNGGATIPIDPAPGFCALTTDPILLSHGITLEIGRVKKPSKNPVTECAIESLGLELLNLSPEGGPVNNAQFCSLCMTLSLFRSLSLLRSFLQYLQPLFRQPALQPPLQTAQLLQTLLLSLLLSFLTGGLAANVVPHFGKIRIEI